MRSIDKRFDAVVALKNASLTIEPGKITALLGSNGSGKSTMVKVLAGLVKPNGGEVLLNGKSIHIRSGDDSRKYGIATAFQDLSLVPTMSVIDNILLGNEPMKGLGLVDRKKARDEVTRLLARFGIDCDLNDYVNTLMPSSQSMLEVAKAVALRPKLLLLDEVTAALHHDEIKILFKVLRELREEGVAMVYVTHRMKEIFEICDSATIMRSGETVASRSIGELTLGDIVFYMTGKRPEVDSEKTGEEEHDLSGQKLVLDVKNLEIEPKVKDISFKAYAGEIVGIGGLEGQGQGEFIRAVLGETQAESGTIRFLDEERRFKTPADGVRSGIGFISGERNREAIFPERTIAENIFAGNAAKGKSFSFLKARTVKNFAKNAIEKYAIKAGQLKDPANSLSGGNQQKMVVARWIAMNPRLLLLDDPTKGVDIHSRLEIHEILKECASCGMTVVMSASDTDELLAIADRIYVFYEGKVSGMLAGEQKNAERLVACMMGLTERAQKEGV